LQPDAMNETTWNDILCPPASNLKVTCTFDLQYNIHCVINCVPALVVGGRAPCLLLALYSEEVYILETEPCTDYRFALFVSLSDSNM